MLKIICPTTYQAEREYIISLFMDEFWKIDYCVAWADDAEDKVVFQQDDRSLVLHDGLFRISEQEWLSPVSLPRVPLIQWDVSQDFPELRWIEPCPLLYSANVLKTPVIIADDIIEFDVDILGSSFFMVTRYEEIANKKRDKYGRFPATASLAYQENFLDRPIVNEYMDILWAAMHRLFPSLKKATKKFRLIPTHDVDHPFGMMYESSLQVLRHFAGDILCRKSISTFWRRFLEVMELHRHRSSYIQEKKEAFSFLFQISRTYGLKDTYYFMNSCRSRLDGNYLVSEPDVRTLLREIHDEGHFLGLHPSYISYLNKEEILNETHQMNQVLLECDLPPIQGARQHYLRWNNPATLQYYEDAGIPYDSSLGFADCIGFRCGICYEYPLFNLLTRQRLKLREQPLIVMEVTLEDYMHLTREVAMEKVLRLAQRCMIHSGDFVILWHNTTLDIESNRGFYQEMIERIFKEHGKCALIK